MCTIVRIIPHHSQTGCWWEGSRKDHAGGQKIRNIRKYFLNCIFAQIFTESYISSFLNKKTSLSNLRESLEMASTFEIFSRSRCREFHTLQYIPIILTHQSFIIIIVLAHCSLRLFNKIKEEVNS